MANRNKIAESRKLFARLALRAKQDGHPLARPDDGRWIENPDEDDLKFLVEAEVEGEIITRQIRIACLTLDDRVLFAVTGFEELDETEVPEGLTWCDLSPASFALSVNALDLMPTGSGATIAQFIDHRYKGIDGFNGFELSEIVPLFPSIRVFKAASEYDYAKDHFRVVGTLLATARAEGPINLDEDTWKAFEALFTGGSSHIQYEDVVQGLLSVSWRGLFLELYRCIELLYGCTVVRHLDEDWPSRDKSWARITDLFEQKLGWRPSEASALQQVMALAAEAIVDRLTISLALEIPEDANKSDVVAKTVYRLRNSIVHSRLSFKRDPAIRKTDEEWNAIIRSMIDLIVDLYGRFGDDFFKDLNVAAPAVPQVMTA